MEAPPTADTATSHPATDPSRGSPSEGPTPLSSAVPVLTAALLVAGLAVLTLAGGAQAASDEPVSYDHNETRHPDDAVRFLVGLEPAAERVMDVDVGDDFHTGTVVDRDRALDFAVVEAPSREEFWSAARNDPAVRYVEEDPARKLVGFTPNDPKWDNDGMYGARQVRADEAWGAVGTGDTSAQVCVVDTGVRYTHEELDGDRWLGGYDYVNDDSDPWDNHGHGTHVSGTAAAAIDNGKGIAGMGNVGLYGVKVLDSYGYGTWSDVASGIRWCADNGGERTVISMSLGGGGGSSGVEDAVQYAREQGSLVVAAAGNSGCCDSVLYPAKYDEVVAVTCTNSDREICYFSSTGPEAEIAAPGRSILSSCYDSDSDYCKLSGTSMSTPHVSGAAALTWSTTHPDSGPNDTEMRQSLRENAGDHGEDGWDSKYGYGLLDVRNMTSPVSLEATRGPDRGDITLDWELADVVDPDNVTEWRVQRAETADGNLTRIATLSPANRSYVDSGLGDGTTRYYRVVALNDTGGTLPSPVEGATTITHPDAPRQPQTQPGPDDGEITVEWTQPHDDGGLPITDYHVYRTDPDGNETLAASVDNTTYVDSGLANDTSYIYEISAENEVGEGPRSDLVEGRTPGPPRAPTNLAADPGPDRGQVNVTWDVPLDDGGYPITAYHVYRTNPNGTTDLVATLNDTAYVDGDLPDNTTFAYEVSAENEKGEGPTTDPVDGTTPGPPGAPTALDVRRGPGAGELNLSWQPPGPHHEGPILSGGSTYDTGTLLTLDDVEGNASVDVSYRYCYVAGTHYSTAYIDTVFDGEIVDTLSFTHPYTGAGECDADDPSTFATRSFTVDQAVDETVRFDYANGDHRVAVADVQVEVTDEVLPVHEYAVYRTNPDGGTVHVGNTTDRTLVDSGLEDNTTYTYEVSATNVVGEGLPSAPADGTTPEPPGPPVEPDVQRGDDLGELVVTWEPPLDDGGSEVLYYHAYRTDPDGTRTLAGTTSSPPFNDTGLETETTYSYEITAENEAGEGPTSVSAEGTTATTPDPPQALKGKPGPGVGNTTIAWEPPADDGGSTIIAYNVYRTDPDGTTSQVATVGSSPYHDTGLEDNTTYTYRVSAENKLGEGDLSDPLNVTSPSLPGPPASPEALSGPGVGEISLSWSPPSDTGGIAVEGYRVYRTDPGGDTTLAGSSGNTSFTDSGLADDTNYTYTISAVNDVGEGAAAGPVTASTPGPPDAPKLLSVTQGADPGEVDVAWEFNTTIHEDGPHVSEGQYQDTGTLVDMSPAYRRGTVEITYRYCYFADSNGANAKIETVFDGEVVDGFYFDTPYTGGGGCDVDLPSTYAERTFTTDVDLEGELRFDYLNGDYRVAIADVTVSADGGPLPVNSYNVYRNASDGDRTLAGSVGFEGRTFTDTGLEDNTTYTYEVAAENDVGEGSTSVTGQAETLAAPWHVRHLQAEHVRTFYGWQVELSWSPPLEDGGDPLDAYHVYRGTSPDEVDTLVAEVPPDETTHRDRPPIEDPPRNYYYEVAAVNLVGDGPRYDNVCISASPLHQPAADLLDPCNGDTPQERAGDEVQEARDDLESAPGEAPGAGALGHGAVSYANTSYRSAQNALSEDGDRGRDGPSQAHLDATQAAADMILAPAGEEARYPEDVPRYGGDRAVNGSTMTGEDGAAGDGDLGLAAGAGYRLLDQTCLGPCVSVTGATDAWIVATLEGENTPAGPSPNAAADELFRQGHGAVDAAPTLP